MFSCSLWESQLFCAEKRQHKNSTLVVGKKRETSQITTLNESTLCSKIETHRRQIKTRKKQKNLTRNHALTDCRTRRVCVSEKGEEE
jgi:hypothetical protein